LEYDYQEYGRKKTGSTFLFFVFYIIFIGFILLWFVEIPSGDSEDSATQETSEVKGRTAGITYVKPFVDRRGHYHKGHARMPVSTSKHAYKNQARSRYYYHTRGKYRRSK